MKKPYLTLVILFFLSPGYAQLANGSFENGSGPDLSGWSWTCQAQSFASAPAGGGNWSVRVWSGNPQSCFPGYAYQKVPGVVPGLSYLLTGWAMRLTSPYIGLYFGTVHNGTVTLQAGDTTSASAWTPLSLVSSFSITAGDTAAVVLFGGATGGPVQGYGFFDLIDLQPFTGIPEVDPMTDVRVFPNPFNQSTTVYLDENTKLVSLCITDPLGRIVRSEQGLSGPFISIRRNGLPPGVYVLRVRTDERILWTGYLVIND